MKQVQVTETVFGTLKDGRQVMLYTIANGVGSSVSFMNLGATIVSLNLPDRQGVLADVVLGFDSPGQYIADNGYLGAVVGRYANRIAKGRFTLDGKEYALALNNGPNSLHGGVVGFDKRLWQAENLGESVRFTLCSADGDEGYPGNLEVRVTYSFDDNNQLQVVYEASTDAATIVNLSQHVYFNLNGHDAGDILGHELMLAADYFTPVDKNLIPTGDISAVAGTPMDFTAPGKIGWQVDEPEEQLKYGLGYDHNWVLSARQRGELLLAASVYTEESGRTMEVFTDQPGIQFYSGNFLDGAATGKGGAIYNRRCGFCLETQQFPDSPNRPGFPSTVLRPGDIYRTVTVFQFGVR